MKDDKHMNNDLNIDDEKLSAFLDAELPEAEMEMIREQLIDDENLANRLADLAMVDEMVAKSYATIDERPVPVNITDLLNPSATETSTVITFPLRKRIQYRTQKYFAVAASVVLVLGFGISQILNRESNNEQSVAQMLEHTASGIELTSANGVKIKPRLTFINKDGSYCRQFFMHDKKSASENIACRENNAWKIRETVAVEYVQQAGTYQAASGGSVLDEKIEQMADGEFFDAHTESVAISQHWAKNE
ncbi:MAG: hypothetical protein EOO68_18580 [Moraxellaceae bacterium]|nr:MAG: hypothetical protein EOO68_18580 [Moraxellaceae bacterium]